MTPLLDEVMAFLRELESMNFDDFRSLSPIHVSRYAGGLALKLSKSPYFLADCARGGAVQAAAEGDEMSKTDETIPDDVLKATAVAIAEEAREWHSDSDMPPVPAHVVERHLQCLIDADRAARPAPAQPVAWAKENLEATLGRQGHDEMLAKRSEVGCYTKPLYTSAAPELVAKLAGALKLFEAFYPMGINPYLDDAAIKARAALAAYRQATGGRDDAE